MGWQREVVGGSLGGSGLLQGGGGSLIVTSLFMSLVLISSEQRPGPGWHNLHVGVVSRHRLDSLDASNDFFLSFTIEFKNNYQKLGIIRFSWYLYKVVWERYFATTWKTFRISHYQVRLEYT